MNQFKAADNYKVSSMHDDLLTPWTSRNLGEYSDYPQRHNPKVLSVIERLSQFGVTNALTQDRFGKDISKLNATEYNQIIAESLQKYYDVIVASVYDQYLLEWDKNDEEKPSEEKRFQQMLFTLHSQKGLARHAGVHLITHRDGFKESGNLVLFMEAGMHLIKSLKQIEELAGYGMRGFGLMYNNSNRLADKQNGLTELGREAVKYMLNHDLIIDLAHSSRKARADVYSLAKNAGKGSLVSYTHGSLSEDIESQWLTKVGERPIEAWELEEIVKMGGLVGLGVTKPFFESTRKIAERIDKTSQIDGGINSIAIGSDWGGVPKKFQFEGLDGVQSMQELGNMLLGKFKMKPADVEKVMRTNVKTYLQKNMPAGDE